MFSTKKMSLLSLSTARASVSTSVSIFLSFFWSLPFFFFEQKRDHRLHQQFSRGGFMYSRRSLRPFQRVHKAKAVFMIVLKHYLLSSQC